MRQFARLNYGWNNKYLAVGNGGWNGSIDAGALANGLRRGYAVSATDTGHQGGGGPWMGSAEKVVDFGHRAVHEMTVKAKTVVSSYYGNSARRSYFRAAPPAAGKE